MERHTVKRYLLGYAATGGGHYHAAKALARQIRVAEPESHVHVFDVFGERNSIAKNIVERGWKVMSTSSLLRPIYGCLYGRLLSNLSVSGAIRWVVSLFTRLDERYTAGGVDHYIALHPAAVSLGANLKKSSGCHLSVVATDHVLHNLHCHELVDEYFVPRNFFVVGQDPKMAIRIGRVWHRQIPIDPGFCSRAIEPRSSRDDEFRVTVSFGAAGLRGAQSLSLIRQLILGTDRSVRFTLIAGSNRELLTAFLNLRYDGAHRDRIDVHGYVMNMPEIMERSHLLVGKPGGLTVSEARHMGLPIAIVDSLPGQEHFNRDAVLSERAGICTKDVAGLLAFIDLLRDPVEWSRWSHPEESQLTPVSVVTPNPSFESVHYGGNARLG